MDLEKREGMILAKEDIATWCADSIADYRALQAVCGETEPHTQMDIALDAAAMTLASHLAGAAGSLGLMENFMVEYYLETAMGGNLYRFHDRLKPIFEVLESQDPDRDRKVADLLVKTLRDAVNVVIPPGPIQPLPPLPPLKMATQEEIDRVLAVTSPRPAGGMLEDWGSVLAAAREELLPEET